MKKGTVEYSPYITYLINYWEKEIPEHAVIFRAPPIEVFLLALNTPSYDKNNCKAINDFIKGIILYSINLKEKDIRKSNENLEAIEELTAAGSELIRDYLKTNFRDYVISTNLLPGHVFKNDGQEWPINSDTIKLFSDRIRKHILTPTDVDFVSREVVKYLKSQCQSEVQEDIKVEQLETKLTDKQRDKLYDLLVEGGLIPATTDRDGFIWAFGGVNSKVNSFSAVWTGENINLAVYLVDRLCYNENLSIQKKYLLIASKIFGIKNPRQIKNGYKNNNIGKPINCGVIDDIISAL